MVLITYFFNKDYILFSENYYETQSCMCVKYTLENPWKETRAESYELCAHNAGNIAVLNP